MTVIVATRTEMAADSRVSDGGIPLYHTEKISLIRGCLVGVAGDVSNTQKFLAWFRKECPADETGMTLDETHDFAGLVLTDKGKLLYYADCVDPDVIQDKYAAIGAGGSYALSAMDFGKTVAEAVKHACDRAPGMCGGKIQVESIIKLARKARKSKPPLVVAPITISPTVN